MGKADEMKNGVIKNASEDAERILGSLDFEKDRLLEIEDLLGIFLEAEKQYNPDYDVVTDMPRIDIHNHTVYSDGQRSIEETIKEAKKKGLDVVGISDHFFTRKLEPSKCISSLRKLESYIHEIEKESRNERGIVVLKGLEIDALMIKLGAFGANMPYPELNKLDYVLFENVNDDEYTEEYAAASKKPEEVKTFTLDDLIDIRSNLGKYVGLAHPNLTRDYSLEDMRELAKHNIFIEISANPGYSGPEKNQDPLDKKFLVYLKEFVKHGGKISVGSDTHLGLMQEDGYYEAILKFLKDNKLDHALVSTYRNYKKEEMEQSISKAREAKSPATNRVIGLLEGNGNDPSTPEGRRDYVLNAIRGIIDLEMGATQYDIAGKLLKVDAIFNYRAHGVKVDKHAAVEKIKDNLYNHITSIYNDFEEIFGSGIVDKSISEIAYQAAKCALISYASRYPALKKAISKRGHLGTPEQELKHETSRLKENCALKFKRILVEELFNDIKAASKQKPKSL